MTDGRLHANEAPRCELLHTGADVFRAADQQRTARRHPYPLLVAFRDRADRRGRAAASAGGPTTRTCRSSATTQPAGSRSRTRTPRAPRLSRRSGSRLPMPQTGARGGPLMAHAGQMHTSCRHHAPGALCRGSADVSQLSGEPARGPGSPDRRRPWRRAADRVALALFQIARPARRFRSDQPLHPLPDQRVVTSPFSRLRTIPAGSAARRNRPVRANQQGGRSYATPPALRSRLCADDALPPALKAPRVGSGNCTPPRSQTCPRGGSTQARDDHAPHVGLREPVRDRSGETEAGCRIAGAGFSFTRHDRNLDDGTGQSDTPPVNAFRSGPRAVRLDDRTLVFHPGAAAMPDPVQKHDPGCGLAARQGLTFVRLLILRS